MQKATLAVSILLGALLLACATTQRPGEQVDDSELSSRVKAKLAVDPDVNPFNIDVDARDGMVTLKGSVDDAATRTEAGRLARNTSGVVSVENEITIGGESASDVVDDAVIVTKIKSKLAADLEVAAPNIDVDSEQGVVTLSGEVRSAEARDEAENLARDTTGVVRVLSNITLGGEEAPTDPPPPCEPDDCRSSDPGRD